MIQVNLLRMARSAHAFFLARSNRLSVNFDLGVRFGDKRRICQGTPRPALAAARTIAPPRPESGVN